VSELFIAFPRCFQETVSSNVAGERTTQLVKRRWKWGENIEMYLKNQRLWSWTQPPI